MRPNNPNKRLRGRNRSKNSNPLARSYESNGPDVKIRGSALQVADKYAQLARDAQSAGDRVMAENYFQHAEHYYRIVAQAYEQMNGQRDKRDDGAERGGRGEDRNEQPGINGYDGVDDDDFDGVHRTVRASNGAHQGDDGGAEDAAEATIETRANGNGAARSNGEPREEAADGGMTTDKTSAEARDDDGAKDKAAEPAEEEQKPKRRSRATRSRSRARKSDAGSEQPTESASEAETAGQTS
jgi:hypothetical protein